MADATDVLTVSEAKLAIGLDDSIVTFDPLLGRYITGVSRTLDDRFGPVVQRAFVETYDGGCHKIRLRKRPVKTVDSVAEYTSTTPQTLTVETNVAKTANDVLLEDIEGVIRRRSNGGDAFFPTGRRNVAVTYTAGRYEATSTVDAKFKLAAGIMLRKLWGSQQAGGTQSFGAEGEGTIVPTFAVPNAVLELLADELPLLVL